MYCRHFVALSSVKSTHVLQFGYQAYDTYYREHSKMRFLKNYSIGGSLVLRSVRCSLGFCLNVPLNNIERGIVHTTRCGNKQASESEEKVLKVVYLVQILPKMANQNEKILLELLKFDGNNICVDCGKKGGFSQYTAYHVFFCGKFSSLCIHALIINAH